MQVPPGALVLAVVASEYLRQVGASSFLALPQEETERLFASLEVHRLCRAEAERDPRLTVLETCTLIHKNQSWLIEAKSADAGPKVWGVRQVMTAESEQPLFLDDDWQSNARRAVASAIDPHATGPSACEYRLAGLLSRQRVTLVCVARLRQSPAHRVHLGERLWLGQQELLDATASFDDDSRLLIAHSAAF